MLEATAREWSIGFDNIKDDIIFTQNEWEECFTNIYSISNSDFSIEKYIFNTTWIEINCRYYKPELANNAKYSHHMGVNTYNTDIINYKPYNNYAICINETMGGDSRAPPKPAVRHFGGGR